MGLLQLAQDYGLDPKKKATTKGGEYCSPCPVCDGSKRFILHPEHEGGRYFCRECPTSGDTIQFLIDFMGLTFKEAADRVGKHLDDLPSRHRYTLPEKSEPTMEAGEKIPPQETWRRQAAEVVAKAHAALLENEERLNWLAGRGLDLEAVKRFKLGWIEAPKFYSLKKWGQPEVLNGKGNKKRLWIPKGYLIPQWNLEKQITMLQVRMDELMPGNKMRYYPVKGSTVTPMIIPPSPSLPPERTAWVTVESRLDALLIARYVGDLVGVMAQGNNSANPCPEAMPLLDASPLILNALDADDAGDASFKKWAKRFKTARRWPVPEGKDPGDYAQDYSGDIRAWILAGLPPGLKIIRKVQDPESGSVKQKEIPQEVTPLCTAIESKCGRLIHVTTDRETYRRLEDEGKIVFSQKEVSKVTAFQKDGGDPSTLLDIKEIFGGSRIIGRIDL